MKSNSDTYPELTAQSNNKTQVRFNIIESVKEDMEGKTRTSYDFDYVEVEGEVSRAKIISAIIGSVYDSNAEFAVINNELAESGTVEYQEYQEYRTKAKAIADEIIV